MSAARENSVKQLSELYNVVIGIALSIAIYNTVEKDSAGFPLIVAMLPNFFIILVTIIPFYHGAVRHLFMTYVEDGGSTRIKSGALMLDFILLFIEGCVFVAMALLSPYIMSLTWALIGLLILDSLWGFLAWLAFTGAQSQYAERKWALINVFAAGALILICIFGGAVLDSQPSFYKLAILVVCLIRTIVDYSFCWNFYYPAK